jgi:hypothetical protein
MWYASAQLVGLHKFADRIVLPRSAQPQVCMCARASMGACVIVCVSDFMRVPSVRMRCCVCPSVGYTYTGTELTCVIPSSKGRKESGVGLRLLRLSFSGMSRGSNSASSGRMRRASPRPAADSSGYATRGWSMDRRLSHVHEMEPVYWGQSVCGP